MDLVAYTIAGLGCLAGLVKLITVIFERRAPPNGKPCTAHGDMIARHETRIAVLEERHLTTQQSIARVERQLERQEA